VVAGSNKAETYSAADKWTVERVNLLNHINTEVKANLLEIAIMKLAHRVPADALYNGMALLLAAWLISPAPAAVTVDRDYSFGDAGSFDAAMGSVGEGSPIGFEISGVTSLHGGDVLTGDDVGSLSGGADDLGSVIVLEVPGAQSTSHTGATYTVTTGRPLLVGAGFGARFDGVDDVLSGLALDRPEQFVTQTRLQYNNPTLTSPIDYTGVTARGLQMWVRPDAAGLSAGARQTIVMDTTESGGVAITADGKWTQIFDSETDDGDIAATVPVAANTWYHVMQHIHPSNAAGAPTLLKGGEAGFTSVVYVDGIAVSALNDLHDAGDFNLGGRVGTLSVGAAELADQDENPLTADFGEFFDGTVDDLQMYLYQSPLGGPFDLFADNEWIANEIATTVPGGVLVPGDVNKDGSVTIAGDVAPFVAGWLSENRLEGTAIKASAVGDWSTWGKGDMNLDGVVDLEDWAIINQANPALGAAIGSSLSIPEPSCALLIATALLAVGSGRRQQRKQW